MNKSNVIIVGHICDFQTVCFMSLIVKLKRICSFKFESFSGNSSLTKWSGKGKGKVSIRLDKDCIFFEENGFLQLDISEKQNKISNEYIWQQIDNKRISLSHARFGYNNKVKLFDLVYKDENLWQSDTDHVCGDDLYSAKLIILNDKIELIWQILGPKKEEIIKYQYFFE